LIVAFIIYAASERLYFGFVFVIKLVSCLSYIIRTYPIFFGETRVNNPFCSWISESYFNIKLGRKRTVRWSIDVLLRARNTLSLRADLSDRKVSFERLKYLSDEGHYPILSPNPFVPIG
jgi:hypothetical protein